MLEPLRWPAGMAWTSWRYLWRISPVHRATEPGGPEDEGPAVDPRFLDDRAQPAEAGFGPLYHRSYRVRIVGSERTPEQLLGAFASDPNRCAPTEVAVFRKTKGDEGGLGPGDEYLVRMPGPWDGPVRVVDRTPTSFRLLTLSDHLEAGQIEFRTRRGDGDLWFEVESWARSGDRLSLLLYDRLRFAREMQLHMWTTVCERAARLAAGTARGGVSIRTRIWDRDRDRDAASEGPEALNFDPADLPEASAGPWRAEEWVRPLPAEAPGEPEPGGSWEAAREVVAGYDFADPLFVRSDYRGRSPLDGRTMRLEIGFLFVRLRGAVRVVGPHEGTRRTGDREARVWGWSYRTLRGHPEAGQMTYEVGKWADTGAVEFRVRRVARWAPIANPVVRLGVRLFGHRIMRAFVRRSSDRVEGMVRARLGLA